MDERTNQERADTEGISTKKGGNEGRVSDLESLFSNR